MMITTEPGWTYDWGEAHSPALDDLYRQRFGEFVPWPFRSGPGSPAPTYCPRCGQALIQHIWTSVGGQRRYIELICLGTGLGRVLAWIERLIGAPDPGHYHFLLGQATLLPEEGRFDPRTGKPR